MSQTATTTSVRWGQHLAAIGKRRSVADQLLTVVDVGLGGIIFVAPYFFGGRHDVGRLVLVSLVAVMATAWFLRQIILPVAYWPRTAAHAVLLLAAAIVALQIVPLRHEWLTILSPRTAELLPLWSPGGSESAKLGIWQTVSLVPHETTKSLAMLLSYSLLFVVVAGRIQRRADIERMLHWVGISAVVMAAFGIVHYFTSDGRYFWFYQHPFRSPTRDVAGAFVNRNHFAHFLVLGIGPLASWLLSIVRQRTEAPTIRQKSNRHNVRVASLLLGAALAIVSFAILLSMSRGGAVALFVAAAALGVIYAYGQLVDPKYLWQSIGLAAVVLGLLSLYGYDEVSRRLNTMARGSLDAIDHDEGRRKIWNANISAIRAGGLIGSGAGSHRMIYPVYLPESLSYEYSHAENGYLQVATETGVAGATLLVVGLVLCGTWCVKCLRHADSEIERLCFAAAAAGLAASAVHSIVDFVWYIPACMSFTIVLAACLLRLSQLALASGDSHGMRAMARGRWLELGAAGAIAGAWSVYTFVGPAMASIHWDRYLLASASSMAQAAERWTDLVASRPASPKNTQKSLNELMLRQLEHAERWDPQLARPHLRLAAKHIAEFELRQQDSKNRMSLAQLRDAALSSSFASPQELQSWLQVAFGANADLLRRAQAEAHTAVALCPLQGEGYLYLAELSFLDASHDIPQDALVDQSLRVRPHDADVLFEVGRHKLVAGNLAGAVEHWQQCFRDPGSHQLKIVYLLAGRIPAAMFLTTFKPDWRTLGRIWNRYRAAGQPQDIDAILVYSVKATERETRGAGSYPPAEIWHQQSSLFAEVGRTDDALACLQRAYACDPSQYHIRQALAKSLADADRFAEAETHLRWCIARRPADSGLRDALLKTSKQRMAQRETHLGQRGITTILSMPTQP